ncbi:Maf family protein [Nesterenkonia sphaerica]|uniref:Nucleoside triphosphate pyrophosphatase n=1 Tax=Nesterenkonia sphaerica TaxID=1804988 RepID=A0A5R9AEQ4_9MICC|nr:Maf family protein [Nesterenkonia sphaerica]TLP77191.1 septum formation inhibitor Maf [Nesterenkonia sphaerica]
MAPPHLVLASASPSRRQILNDAGITFDVVVSAVDEPAVVASAVEAGGPLSAAEEALLLARAKAEDVAASPEARGALVLGCDSVFELEGVTYGKPYEVDVVLERWKLMRGKTGTLHTGHWLVDTTEDPESKKSRWAAPGLEYILGSAPTGQTRQLNAAGETVSSHVHFGHPTDEQIIRYAETGEPLQCAGAFTLEGGAAEFIEQVDGDREAVIGISPAAVERLLASLGHDLTDYTGVRNTP